MWINKKVDPRLREYIIRQLLNFLRFLLAANDIEDTETKTFDEVCDETRKTFTWVKAEPEYMPKFKCLWDIIFNLLGLCDPYTDILSAYCRSNNITSKKDLYIKMSEELDVWVDAIDRHYQFNDIIIMALGMSQNQEIWYTFTSYNRIYGPPAKFYKDALAVLIKHNFKNINPLTNTIQYVKPFEKKYDDPLQQFFYEHIMIRILYVRTWVCKTHPDYCKYIQRIIRDNFSITIQIQPTYEDAKIPLKNMKQIINYCESKIPQYPTEIKRNVLFLYSVNSYICYYNYGRARFTNLAKMAELSYYYLRNLPMVPIMHGFCGATPIHEIPLEQIPEYYAQLTHSDSVRQIKPVRI